MTRLHTNPDGSTVAVPDTADIGEEVIIEPHTVLGACVSVGVYATIGERTVLGAYARVGSYTTIGPNTVLGEETFLGDRSTLGDHTFIDDYARVGAYAIVGYHTILGKHASIGYKARIGPHAIIKAEQYLHGYDGRYYWDLYPGKVDGVLRPRFRYGCEDRALDDWFPIVGELCEEHEPYRPDIRRSLDHLLATARTFVEIFGPVQDPITT